MRGCMDAYRYASSLALTLVLVLVLRFLLLLLLLFAVFYGLGLGLADTIVSNCRYLALNRRCLISTGKSSSSV